MDDSDFISKEEVRSILLNLNINVSQLILDDYLDVHNADVGADSNRSGDTYTLDNFLTLFCLILKNQATYYRELYNGKKKTEINYQQALQENNLNVRVCFDVYDVDKSGYLDYFELRTLLQEMNLHKQFA